MAMATVLLLGATAVAFFMNRAFAAYLGVYDRKRTAPLEVVSIQEDENREATFYSSGKPAKPGLRRLRQIASVAVSA